MTDVAKTGVTRRTVLAGAAAGTALLSMPSIVRAQDKSLKVGVYGGYFEESFDQHIFPDFTSASRPSLSLLAGSHRAAQEVGGSG